MKILISETQLKNVIEQKLIGYTPEKIDGFVIEGNNVIKKFKNTFLKYFSQLQSLNVGWVFKNLKDFKGVLDDMQRDIDILEKVSLKYYSVIEIYEIGDYPENVKKLSKIYDTIESIVYEIQSVRDIYVAIHDSIEHYSEWNKHSIEQNIEI